MTANDSCPSEALLRQLVSEQLPPETAERVTEHVGTCPDCQEFLGSSDSLPQLDSRLAILRQANDRSAHLAEAIERAKAMGGRPSNEPPQAPQRPAPSPQDLTAFEHDGYELLGQIGQGGMGSVYKAREHSLNRVVAIKVLSPMLACEDSAKQRFLQEARAAASVAHPNVITIHAVSDKPPLPYLVMEYIEGGSLQQHLDAGAKLSLENVIRIGRQVAAGLAAAHSKGVIHRDIKPGNILLNSQTGKVLLGDFGLALANGDSRLTRTGTVVGTPAFVAPEVIESPDATDHRADLFSLGVVLYAMCAGDSPFQADSLLGTLQRLSAGPPAPLSQQAPDTPPWLSQIVMRLLERNPANRFQSAAEVREALGQRRETPHPSQVATAVIEQSAQDTTPAQVDRVVISPPRIQAATRKKRKGAGWLYGAGVATLALVALLAGLLVRSQRAKPVAQNPPQRKAPDSRADVDEADRTGATRQATAASSTSPSPTKPRPFAVLNADGEVIETYARMSEALRQAPAEGLIEIRHNGVLEIETCTLASESLTIAAAAKHRPILQLSRMEHANSSALMRIAGDITLKGLELRLQEGLQFATDVDEDDFALLHVESAGQLELIDCTLVVEDAGFCVSSETDVVLRNCQLHAPRSTALVGNENAFYDLRNCWLSGEIGIEFHDDGRPGAKLIESSFACLQTFLIHSDPSDEASVQVESARSLFLCGESMIELESESEGSATNVLDWTGVDNVFAGSLYAESEQNGSENSEDDHDFARWRQEFSEQNSRYVESPLEVELDELQDRMPDNEFRLAEVPRKPSVAAGAHAK